MSLPLGGGEGTAMRGSRKFQRHPAGSVVDNGIPHRMKNQMFNTTVLFYPNKNPKLRLFALWYFTILMIVWNILGHTFLGFEQSDATTFVGVGTAIFFHLFLE